MAISSAHRHNQVKIERTNAMSGTPTRSLSVMAVLAGLAGLLAGLPSARAATYTWNRNLTGGDTAWYDMDDDGNWAISGTPTGSGPGSTDDVVVPNGITARWEALGTGSAPTRSFRALSIGSAAPGNTQVLLRNSYTGGTWGLRFYGDVVGDPDNGTTRHLDLQSGRGYSLYFGTGSTGIQDTVADSSFWTIQTTFDMSGYNSSGGNIQVSSANPVTASGTIATGLLQFRGSTGTFTATGPLNIAATVQWRDSSGKHLVLNNYDHVIYDIGEYGTGFTALSAITATGGSITMRDWSVHKFQDPVAFDLDGTTVRMYGNGTDASIVLSVRGRDDGRDPLGSGLVDNFALGTLVIGDEPGDVVTLRTDGAYMAGSLSSDAALYVGTLDLTSGAGLVIPEGTRLYYVTLLGDTANVTGIERLSRAVPEPASLALFAVVGTVLWRRPSRSALPWKSRGLCRTAPHTSATGTSCL
ncbi:MAG: hypothetical protein BWZ02_00278 [Lentisphaerae bacterium ADurb.BinA184]|nr:MAG: hypothetical protein BWZ02_00278 [Lentisphaerae bacterium ADurb.BinA184]